jgi:hypothetical protein
MRRIMMIVAAGLVAVLTDIGLPLQAGEGLIFVGLVSPGKIGRVISLNQPAD